MYQLTKMSGKGFEVVTDSAEVVELILNALICTDCRAEMPADRAAKAIAERIDGLLDTRCGAEFILETITTCTCRTDAANSVEKEHINDSDPVPIAT